MFYEIDFIKVFIPKLANLANNIVINFVENKYQYLKQNGIMLCRNDFSSAYPDFNLNIYYIFNDDLKNYTELQLRYHWHIKGHIEKQISNLNTFFELYDKYDNEFFYKINKELINKYYEDNYIYYFDINKNKLNKELVNIKTFHTFSKNNKNFIKSIYDFFITNPDINIEVIGLFNKDLFRTHVSKRTMKDNEIKEIIYFYLEEIEKENRETILNKEEFYNKYDKFDLDIFKKFNKKYEKVEEIICITDYHSNNLIGSLNDFLEKHIDFNLDNFKKNILDKNLSIIDNLVKFHLDKNYRREFKKYTISRDYFNIFNPEYKNIQNNEFLNLYKDREINDLLFSDNDFKRKYPLFSLDIFNNFNLDYKNVEKQNYHLNYNTTRLIGCLEDFYFSYPEYNDNKIQSIDELIKYHKKKIGEIDLDLDLDLDELMEIYPDFDQIFYTSVYSDLRNYDKYDSIRHWHYHGKNEGRIYKIDNYFKKKNHSAIEKRNIDNFDTNNKICIFHCGNIDIFTLIIETYPIIKELNLIITYYNDLYKDKFKDYNLKKYELLKVENSGMDCGPMLVSIKYLLNNNTLYNENTIFYKIHTKKIDKWRDRLISDMLIFNDFNLYKDKPYIFGSNEYIYSDKKGINKVYIDEIVKRNDKKDIGDNKDIDYYYDKYYENFVSGEKINKFTDLLPSLEFYKNYEPDLNGINNLEHWEKSGINEFHRKSNINYIKKYQKFTNYFIAGTIFGFNKKYLDLFKNYNLEYEHSILEEGYTINCKGTTNVHAWEYYFGLILFLNDGIIIGVDNDNNNIYKKTQNKSKIKYSVINIPFKKSDIAIFLILPGDNPDSGGFRTILKYIDFLNKCGYSLDIYFGICWNDKELEYNVDKINKDGIPTCENWLNENDTDIIYKLLKNIEKYNIIDINSNNFYLGLKCQKKYKVLIANAWQISGAVYKNKEYANSIYYIIQDREELFYPNDEYLKKNVIKTYRKEYNYYCITQYLGNYFKENYEYISIQDSYMGVDLDIYKNLKYERDNSVVIPYYGDLKPGRKPDLVRKIIDILSRNDIKCYVFPYNFEMVNENIINLGIMTENELNELYNKHKVGIIFSNTNPSRLGFEMYASGMKVIEYDSEFTKYDMPNEYFKKIKDEGNILNITNKLFNKEYNDRFLKNIDINKDYEIFLNFIKKNI